MTTYNYIADRPYEIDNGSMECVFALMVGSAQEMRRDAVRQSKNAFKSGREQIYLAMTIVRELMEYVKAEGFMALSSDVDLRNRKEHVLDVIEKNTNCNVPLRQYLEFGLEHLSCGEAPDYVEELMVNRYYANSYAAKDALIAYIYSISVVGMIYGANFQEMFEYFESFIPDEEINTFNAYIEKERKQCDNEKYQYMNVKIKEKFRMWDMHKDILQMDKNRIMTIFNEMLNDLDDENIEAFLQKISHVDLCYSLLGADESTRIQLMERISENHRIYLIDHWMSMPFSEDTVEKCIEAINRVVNAGIIMKKSV